MTKIQEIETKLLSINDSVFQDLCDAYISLTDPLCMESVCRTGMATGKQKPRKGTPDSYYLTTSGDYVLIEYTTQSDKPKKALLDKIKEDIDKCTSPEKTGVAIKDIAKMIYCLNSKLDINEKNDLKQYAHMRGLPSLDIKSLDMLPTALFSKASHLAREFLGVAIDSGQILPVSSFIKRYERSGIATPISNKFISRNAELTELERMVTSSAVTILTGPPGVGKTKLVIELLDSFQKKQSGYEVYCIDNCNVPIYDDLKTYLTYDKKFILLIDDANRQLSNLKQILSLLRDRQEGEMHLILTVRDYAFREIEAHTHQLDPGVLNLDKFTNEQIAELLQSPDFDIKNGDYISRIQEIAEGNPRLAIMGALTAIENQNLHALNDVSLLYDQYFAAAINREVFNDQMLLQAMGLICFFHSIDRSDEKHYEKILADFSIDRYAFEEAIIKLEQFELVESSEDQTVVRVSEQVLSTYFFYKTFFKEPVLSFETALSQYFFSHLYRIRETVIPANNTFGYEKVCERILPFLDTFWKEVEDDHDKAVKFLDMFWLYKMDDALHFVAKHTASLPDPESATFLYSEKETKNHYGGHLPDDRYLDVVKNFYYNIHDYLPHALEVGVAYVTKKPEVYSRWVKMLRDLFVFTRQDERYGYYRQRSFVKFVTTRNPQFPEILRKQMFFDVVPSLMKTSYQVVGGGLKRNTMVFYRYDLRANKFIKEIRKRIWKQLHNYFAKNRDQGLLFFREYLKRTPDKVKDIFKFDLSYILGIIGDYFDPSRYKEAFLVDEFVLWFGRIGIKDERFAALQEQFNSKAVGMFYTLTRDSLYRKPDYKSRLEMEKWHERKEREIRDGFKFQGLRSFQSFYKSYEEIDRAILFYEQGSRLGQSLDFVMDETYKRNKKNGYDFLKYIIKQGNRTEYVPLMSLKILSTNEALYRKLYALFKTSEYLCRDQWLCGWFRHLPEGYVTEADAEQVVQLYATATKLWYVDIEWYDKFENVSPGFFIRLFETIYERNADKSLRIFVYDLMQYHLPKFGSNLPLIKKTYLQQQGFADHFDHDYSDFLEILKLDPRFLIEYIQFWSKESYMSSNEHSGISIVWLHEEAEKLIREAFDWVAENHNGYFREDLVKMFFKKIPGVKKANAVRFLKSYIDAYHNNEGKMNMVFDSVRECLHESLEELLLYFLEQEQSIDVFAKLEWTPSMLSGGGGTIFGEVRAGHFQRILTIVEKIVNKPYRFSEHKTYLREKIRAHKRSADQERKRKFMNSEW